MHSTSSTPALRGINWRLIGWSAAAALLATPFVAMRFTAEVNWTLSDFVVMGALIGTIGLLFEGGVRLSGNGAYRVGYGAGLLAIFLLVWANLAVGMIGNEDHEFNLLFAGVVAVAIGGACIAQFRPRGMAWAALTAALLQCVLAAVGSAQDVRGAIFTAICATPWLIAAALFGKAAGAETAR